MRFMYIRGTDVNLDNDGFCITAAYKRIGRKVIEVAFSFCSPKEKAYNLSKGNIVAQGRLTGPNKKTVKLICLPGGDEEGQILEFLRDLRTNKFRQVIKQGHKVVDVVVPDYDTVVGVESRNGLTIPEWLLK